jgi:hypothetical protein
LAETPYPEVPRTRTEAYLDAYRPLPPAPAPATGSSDPHDTELAKQEEPPIPGTLFLTVVLLMIIAAIWIVMYILLLAR